MDMETSELNYRQKREYLLKADDAIDRRNDIHGRLERTVAEINDLETNQIPFLREELDLWQYNHNDRSTFDNPMAIQLHPIQHGVRQDYPTNPSLYRNLGIPTNIPVVHHRPDIYENNLGPREGIHTSVGLPNLIEGIKIATVGELQDIERELYDAIRTSTPQEEQALTNYLYIVEEQLHKKKMPTLSGRGITKRRRGRPKGSGIAHPFVDKVDKSRGIQPTKRYISFGKYLINTNKLNDDVIAIKRPSGANIVEFPSNRVSKKLSKVVKVIVGGGQPSFNDLSELTEEEKAYLYKISRKAEIADKLSIPTPPRDQQDKDINQFEIMKGELMSGNDSKELVRNFKALLVKLSKNGSLPKNQVNEIMSDLLQMGY